MSVKNLEDNEMNRENSSTLADVEAFLRKKKTFPRGPEEGTELKRFSDEARRSLEKQGYLIYELTGQSIESMRDAGRQILSHDEKPEYKRIFSIRSIVSEVAINPNEFFLPHSTFVTQAQREKIIEQFSDDIGKKIPGVKAIMGTVPNYVELIFIHLDKTRDWKLFKEGSNYAATKTEVEKSWYGRVGDVVPVTTSRRHGFIFLGYYSLNVFSTPNNHHGGGSDHASPLIVPS